MNFVSETLRMYPAIWMSSRTSVSTIMLGSNSFQAGTDFFFSSYQLQHDPRTFESPEIFSPERWSGQLPLSSRPGFTPFSGGGRKCIGDRFAVYEILHVLIAIVRRWEVSLVSPGTAIKPRRLAANLTPERLFLRIDKRP
ncbi:cytochrome P450 [Streptomyces canus]|nr:cytochrome P450 [Streptomyces canus]